jgi:hypothetical protein
LKSGAFSVLRVLNQQFNNPVAMTQSPVPAIHQPRFTKCAELMTLIRLMPNGAGSEVQTFECTKCGETNIVDTAEPRKKAQG